MSPTATRGFALPATCAAGWSHRASTAFVAWAMEPSSVPDSAITVSAPFGRCPSTTNSWRPSRLPLRSPAAISRPGNESAPLLQL